ncbi:MAG TPA: ABC-F family ATP-binding cassette domain-containing protein [Candidatus Sulfotelmatobacter sp.]|nr:ABC-F family ATP-binding cassette domain-containing protein [Candidatus Sulfotelmatobacter sp.]
MIQAEGIGKGYGACGLFRDLTWHIREGARIGLVGPNGAGKTTLCRILAGLEAADAGVVRRPRACTIGYLAQEVEVGPEGSVLGHVLDGFPEVRRLEEEMAALAPRMAAAADAEGHSRGESAADLTRRYGELQHRYEVLGGYRLETDARAILGGLGFAPDDVQRPLAAFSGGWRMRAALARLLLARPDLLLLDEPTNHLDLEALAWLEGFLAPHPGTIILVSHDRHFLNRMADEIAELELGSFTRYPGTYDDYLEQKAARAELLEATRRQQAKRVAEIQRFIERFRYKATKARQVQSRVKALAKMGRVEAGRAPKRIHFRFPQPPHGGQVVCALRGLHKAYGETVVYAGVDLTLARGDRIALVGPNGAGKSTLLKVLSGVLPFERGERALGHNVSVHYYAQHQLDQLTPARTVLEEIEAAAPDEARERLRGILGAFLFGGDDVEKKVAVLSGGERARLALAKMLVRPANFLCLDEPTNHLDLPAREVLEAALARFEGTIVFISHDRYFMNRLATQVVEVKGGRLRAFPGDYDAYLERASREAAAAAPRGAAAGQAAGEGRNGAGPGPAAGPAPGRRAERRARAEALQARGRALRPLRDRLRAVEAEIQGLEGRLGALGHAMADPSLYKDGDRARTAAHEKRTAEARLGALLAEWEDLSHQLSNEQ